MALSAIYLENILTIQARWEIDGSGHVLASLHAERNENYVAKGIPAFPTAPKFSYLGLVYACSCPKILPNCPILGTDRWKATATNTWASSLGCYSTRVEDEWEGYLKPQENGSHWGSAHPAAPQ